MGALLEGSGVDYQRSRQVIVFYNGEYFGIHDLREHLNEHFVETNYGIDASTVESIKHTNRLVTANGGTIDGYVAMLDFVDASDFSEAGSTAYQTIQAMLDVEVMLIIWLLRSFIEMGTGQITFVHGVCSRASMKFMVLI